MSYTHSNTPCFALVDCNNFYASCERVFNPRLYKKPVIVLSNNDGCVISRSNEAKLIGIKMGEPFFKIKKLCDIQNVAVFSSNFALYGDMSKRVMNTLQNLCPDVAIYSIDEAFLRLDNLPDDPYQYAIKIRKKILKDTGIPVSIGLAPTKTLAKIAGHTAKGGVDSGVFDLRNTNSRKAILLNFPVSSIWGIGKKWAKKCEELKIYTAKTLCDKSENQLRKYFNITMISIVRELKGQACLTFEETIIRKNIMCSRSFTTPRKELSTISEPLSEFCARAALKARKQNTKAQAITVYLRTSSFASNKMFYGASETKRLKRPSNDTIFINKEAKRLLRNIYKAGYHYKKVGVILMELTTDETVQDDFFEEDTNSDNKKLMTLLDSINDHIGKDSLFLASRGTQKNWLLSQTRRSPRYTTHWKELPSV